MAALPAVAITTGEPAGIGPEISLRAAWSLRHEARCILLGDAAFLAMVAGEIDPAIRLSAITLQALRHGTLPDFGADRLTVVDIPLAHPVRAGEPDPGNARAVLATLDVAIEGINASWFDAMATAPLQKSTINDAGIAFSGHTEYLAQHTGARQVVMMLAGPLQDGRELRVALATTHLPLKEVPAAITREALGRVIDIIDHDLKERFGLDRPRILVAGLNPHAGEGGYLGREEIEVIGPEIEAARMRGIECSGPYPADTLFQPKYLEQADCVLAMYHDQGLPVLKHATFGRGVNITLGLPLVRTSVDHGTALDVAARGTGLADCGSMEHAVRIALDMARSRSRHSLTSP